MKNNSSKVKYWILKKTSKKNWFHIGAFLLAFLLLTIFYISSRTNSCIKKLNISNADVLADLNYLEDYIKEFNNKLYGLEGFDIAWKELRKDALTIRTTEGLKVRLEAFFEHIGLDHASVVERDLNNSIGLDNEAAIDRKDLEIFLKKIPVLEINKFLDFVHFIDFINLSTKNLREIVAKNDYIVLKLGGGGGSIATAIRLLGGFYSNDIDNSQWDQEYPIPIEEFTSLSNKRTYKMRRDYNDYLYHNKRISHESYKLSNERFFSKNADDISELMSGEYFLNSTLDSSELINPELRIFLVSDESCSSACEIFLLALKSQIDVIHIGKRSRGELYFANPGLIELSNSCLSVLLPTAKLSYKKFADPSGRSWVKGIEPDILSEEPMRLIGSWFKENKELVGSRDKKVVVEELKNISFEKK